MKRLLILFLLVLMPLQIVWAATDACCGPDEEAAARHVCHGWQGCDEDDGVAADGGCDCCHHASGGAPLAYRPPLAAAPRLPQAGFEPPHYVSHIPDLVPPPDRPRHA